MRALQTLFAVFLGVFNLPVSLYAQYSTSPDVVDAGRQLFETQCAACHNFYGSWIGPNLAGITLEVSHDWLRAFVANPRAMIDSGDNRATRVYEEFSSLMPPFDHLDNTELDSILSYLHTEQERQLINPTVGIGPPVEDPVPFTAPESELVLHLLEIAQAPASADDIPRARINNMGSIPGSPHRLFVQDFRSSLYELRNGQLHEYLNVASRFEHFKHDNGLASGFGGFAFHPDFNSNGLLYTVHSEDPATSPAADFSFDASIPNDLRWVVSEWRQEDPNAPVFTGSHRELMRVDIVLQYHGVQEVLFNPTSQPGNPDYGMLYIGIGDGGAVQTGYSFLVQDKSKVWGNILRIDPAGNNSSNGNYGIPPDNPFVGEEGALGEIWAMGYRNPHRITWDTTGRMLATDIGHHQIEELNIIEKGLNYGWPEREGTFLFDKMGDLDNVYALPANDETQGYTYPILQYDHDESVAILGGYVYQGDRLDLLKGKYIFGGIANGRVFIADATRFQPGQQSGFEHVRLRLGDGPLTSMRELTGQERVDLRIGQDGEGELYFFTKPDGKIYKVIDIQSR